jgi:hypothetical protein
MAAQPISTPTEPPPEIKSLIDKALGGFNRKNSALYNSAFVPDAVIVDGMAPYRWTGANAQGRWFADAENWAHELGVADENITYDRIVRADVVDARLRRPFRDALLHDQGPAGPSARNPHFHFGETGRRVED